MAGATYVQPGDVINRWRPLSPEETIRAAVLCRDAGIFVRRWFEVDAMLASEPPRLDPALLRLVLANAIVRTMQQAGNVKSETTGPFAITYATVGAALALTDADLRAIVATPRAGVGSVGSIRTRTAC